MTELQMRQEAYESIDRLLRSHLDDEDYACFSESLEIVFNHKSGLTPITDEQILTIGKELGMKCRLGGNPNIDFDYARAIEAHHGIK